MHNHAAPRNEAVIHQVVTESITTTSQGTTTVRQEQHSVLATNNQHGSTLTDWLSGTVHPNRNADATRDNNNAKMPSHIVSTPVIQVSAAGTGLMNKYYYRFDNAQLSRDKITVYYDPETFTPPTEPFWVDIISGNATSPDFPTMIVLKGDLHNTKWFYLPVEYVPATLHQPKCTSWVDPMAYLLQVRYSYNIWHTWNEGLMGIFQTLRELGQLPLASISRNGLMTEITDGMGEGCPYAFSHELNRTVQEKSCSSRRGLLDRTHCDPRRESWCREGAIVSSRRASGGPVIVPYTASSVMNVWAHLYRSMTQDVRDWSTVEGACFRSLVVGKTSTLNFYQAINNTEPDPRSLATYPRIETLAQRVEAMAVFKQYVHSAQKEYVQEQEAQGQAPWAGYKSKVLERLRQGVGPENLVEGVLRGINAREVPGMVREERNELRQRWKMHDRLVERAVQHYLELYGGASEARAAAVDAGTAWVDDYADDYEGIAYRVATKPDGFTGTEDGAAMRDESKEDGVEDSVLEWGKNAIINNNHQHIGNEYSDEEDNAAQFRRRTARRRHLLSDIGSAAEQEETLTDSSTTNNNNNTAAVEIGESEVKSATTNNSSSELGRRRSMIEGDKWFDKTAVYKHETPRPVVTYMSRNFFSRGVLNEGDILAYILARYNVTLRVTTFEEPLHVVMDSLSTTDVMFGMHGAGWTNGLFIKRGATTMQMFPYGWRLPDNSTLRGYNYREIVLASECPYEEWVNPVRENAFLRRSDYSKKAWNTTYSLHPEPDMPMPTGGTPGNMWIYQNTYVDMDLFGPEIDNLMRMSGIHPMPGLESI